MISFFTALLFAAALFLLPFVPSLMAPYMVRREAALAANPP